MVNFDFSTNADTIIKVIGVGGGGGNAVNYMFNQGIGTLHLLYVIPITKI